MQLEFGVENEQESVVPNLDAMDPDELEEFAEDIMDEESLPRPVRLQLKSYAEHKMVAMRHRSRGYIGIARKEEALCDRIYNNLPVMYQW